MSLGDKNSTSKRPAGAIPKILAAAAIAVGLVVAVKYFNLQHVFCDAIARVEKAGPVGPLVFLGLYVAACVFMVPASILTLGAGAVFGVVKGSLLVLLFSTVGATAAFLIGRYLARDIVARRVERNATFQAVDGAVAAEGWKIVGLMRLSPVVPFNLLNYAFGLTRVSLRDYVLASGFGMIPGTVMYVYLGSLAGSLAELSAEDGGRIRSPAEWAFYVVGLIATVAVTVVVTRIARHALGRRMKPLAERKENQS